MLINRQDYELFLAGKKSATIRYGSRLEEFEVGKVVPFEVNDGSGDFTTILITDVYTKRLHEVTEEEAKDIGDYSKAECLQDFFDIYKPLGRDVYFDTVATIVYFVEYDK